MVDKVVGVLQALSTSTPTSAGPDAALAEIKRDRAAWVDWLKRNGLSDIGNDPKRHDAATHERFYASVKGGAQPVAAAVESSDDVRCRSRTFCPLRRRSPAPASD